MYRNFTRVWIKLGIEWRIFIFIRNLFLKVEKILRVNRVFWEGYKLELRKWFLQIQ
jgi:hypothetical protein